MTKQKTTVTVSIEVPVEFDPDQFTPEFQAHFNRYFFPYDTVREHLEHLARNRALGIDGPRWDHEARRSRTFVEGYGNLDEMGITLGEPEAVDYDFDASGDCDIYEELPATEETTQ